MSISIFDPVPVQLAPSSEAAPGLASAIRWGRVNVAGLAAQVLVAAAAMVVSIWWLTLLHQPASGATVTKDEAAVRLGAVTVTSRLNDLLFVASTIIWLVWLYKSYASLTRLGTRRTRHASPSRAVMMWFVPFVNLVAPYQVVREIWLRTAGLNAAEPDLSAKTPLISWWWALYLIWNLVALVAGALLSWGIRDPATVFEVVLAAHILHVSAALLAIMTVRRIASLQLHALAQRDAAAA
jgi:hypothetical protein